MARPQHYVYVESEDSFPSDFICTVCHDVAGTHTACPGCSQTFCQSCVHRWFNTQKSNVQGCTCPYCRRKLKYSELKHDPAVQQKLDALLVLCPNSSQGCTSTVARAAVDAHLQRDCALQQCECQFCDVAGLRADIQQHEQSSCSKRPVPCENAAAGCTAEVPLDLMSTHLDFQCDLQPRPCPQCKQAVRRRDWSLHLQAMCPSKQHCPLRLYGCSYTGTATEVQQHGLNCPHLDQRQELQQLLADTGASNLTASALALLTHADAGELPSTCLQDEYSSFGVRTLQTSVAAACEMLLNAVPAAALPPRLQQQQGLVAQVAALQAQQRPAVLAAQTASRQTPGHFDPSLSAAGGVCAANSSSMLPAGMSPAEALALGFPQCLSVLRLHPDSILETAWRIALNLMMIEVLNSDAGDTALPGCFMLYTALCRAWDIVSHYHNDSQAQQQQRHQQEEGDSMVMHVDKPPASSIGRQAASGNSTSSTSSQGVDQQQEDPGAALPGLERGLLESEFEAMNNFIFHDRSLMAGVNAAVSCVQQFWLTLGSGALLPDQGEELGQLMEALHSGMTIMSSIAMPTKQTSTSRGNRRSSGSGGRQQEQHQRGGDAAVGPLEAAAAAGTASTAAANPMPASARNFLFQLLLSHRFDGASPAATAGRSATAAVEREQLQQPTNTAAGTQTSRSSMNAISNGAVGDAHQKQQHDQQRAAASPEAGSDVSSAPADFNTVMEKLRIEAAAHVNSQAPRPHPTMPTTKLHALEWCTSVLLLHHMRAEHVESSMIPDISPQLMAGFRGFWGTSILAAARVQLGPGFRLGWQAVAVLNDMVSGLVARILQVIGEGFYDAAEGRVQLDPKLAMAAAQLVIPSGLIAACLERLSVLSSRYHDEECDDLNEVTWQQLASRVGLHIELDKLVYLVDERLPVTLEESEDGSDMDDGSSDDDDGYEESTDDESADGQLGPVVVYPPGGTRPAGAIAARAAASDGTASDDGSLMEEESEGGWESADSDEVMELLAPPQQQQQGTGSGAADTAAEAEVAVDSSAATAAGLPGDTNQGRTPAVAGSDFDNTQQQEQLVEKAHAGTSSAGAEQYLPRGWRQQFLDNLQRLSADSADLPALERHVVQTTLHGVSIYAERHSAEQQGAAAGMDPGSNAPQQAGGSPTHSDRLQRPTDGSSSSSGTDSVAAAAAAEPDAADAGRTGQQQQPQQEREAKEKEAGDATTHGVVLIAGLVEFVLMQLLAGAAEAAAHDAAVAAAAAVGQQCGFDTFTEQQKPKQHLPGNDVYLSARHVLLAATNHEDLRTLVIDRPIDQHCQNPAAVVWAGVVPEFNTALLPDPYKEPLIAWLLQLAAGKLQQQVHDRGSSTNSSSTTAVAYPADLRYYCGKTWTASITPGGVHAAAGPSNSSGSATIDIGAVEGSVTCCYLSGWQCSSCAAATATLAEQPLDAQLDTAWDSIEQVIADSSSPANRNSGSSSKKGISLPSVTSEQQLALQDMMRMYHLQQPWWYDASITSSISSNSSSNSSCTAEPSQLELIPDQLQLGSLQQLLTPLRDVVAIREIHLQQQQQGLAWPKHDFDALVHEALTSVASERQQQDANQRRLQQLVITPAGLTAAVMGDEHSQEPESDLCDMEVDDEAFTLLATAAEDFLVQQLKAANQIALHAGREEVRPEDLRLALSSSGYRHMLRTVAEAGNRGGGSEMDLKQLYGFS